MATVLARHGSAPATPGQKLYLASDLTCVGTVGGGAIEREVLLSLMRMCQGKAPRTHQVRDFKLGAELGMCCGGRAEILIEPIDGLMPCLIVGAGHVATATAPLLARVGYAVTVIDPRESWATAGRIPGVTLVEGEYDVLMNDFPTRGALLVMTHDHAEDQKAIAWGLRKGFAYVGGVGSRAKAERTRARLEQRGVSAEDRARIRMPIGAPINARLPDEIAVAIAAEMVAWRRRG
jgi:xanthine dehydrogenase accessory factor